MLIRLPGFTASCAFCLRKQLRKTRAASARPVTLAHPYAHRADEERKLGQLQEGDDYVQSRMICDRAVFVIRTSGDAKRHFVQYAAQPVHAAVRIKMSRGRPRIAAIEGARERRPFWPGGRPRRFFSPTTRRRPTGTGGQTDVLLWSWSLFSPAGAPRFLLSRARRNRF